MSTIAAYGVFLVLLLPQMTVIQTNQASPVRIGFSCCHFYDTSSGTPVFMTGEEIWLFAEQDLTATLNDPNQPVASAKMLANSSLELYRFKTDDPMGLWRLDIRTAQEDTELSVYLVPAGVNAFLESVAYGFAGTKLTVDGGLTIDGALEGGTLLLVRESSDTTLETGETPTPDGFLLANVTWSPLDPFTLSVSPYTSNFSGLNGTNVWAELSSDVALVKPVGTSRVVTLVPQVLARSNRASMNLRSTIQQSVKLILPGIHQVGSGGDAPLRMGPVHVTVYIQTQNVIYTLQADTFLLEKGLLSSVASSAVVPPLTNSVSFNLQDNLQRLSNYDLYLVAREAGLGVVWKQEITTPVTRLHVVNTLTGAPIDDYAVKSDQFQSSTKVGPETFVIPSTPEATAELSVSVGGFALRPDEFSPHSTKLEPLSTVEIDTQASTTQLQVMDAVGNTAAIGTMRISRILGETKTDAVIRLWNASNGIVNLTLPIGQYEAAVTVDGSTGTTQFTVSHGSENVTLTLSQLIMVESRNQLILTGAVLVIIVGEGVLAIRVWRALARRRKN